ncbi:YozE family protein [Solibacillus sp. CAU 1738]|uniref:YozE family protein n=1 Tax=Solibacillus sp. CAU 1738 TaxID=3140363 RepID=UPI0032605C1D
MMKTFYMYVLTYRGGAWSDPKARFAEACFEDHSFPKNSSNFEELSLYIEMHGDDLLTIATFDELWELYVEKYNL